jgi:hypothetical protein
MMVKGFGARKTAIRLLPKRFYTTKTQIRRLSWCLRARLNLKPRGSLSSSAIKSDLFSPSYVSAEGGCKA